MLIIGLNGAPESGKDYFKDMFNKVLIEQGYEDRNYIVNLTFKDILFNCIDLCYMISESENVYENNKNKPYEEYRNLNKPLARQILIDFSENCLKTNLGKDFIPRKTIEKINSLRSETDKNLVVFISDFGFENEYLMFKDTFGDSFISVKIDREGKTFANDSRNYVSHHDYVYNNPVDTYDKENNDVITKAFIQQIINYAVSSQRGLLLQPYVDYSMADTFMGIFGLKRINL